MRGAAFLPTSSAGRTWTTSSFARCVPKFGHTRSSTCSDGGLFCRRLFSFGSTALEYKLVTVERALLLWGLPLLPLCPQSVTALGATLKAGGYRSAASYISAYRGHAERAGQTLYGPELRACRDAIRSCERGMGGPIKPRPLPFHRLRELPGMRAPWVQTGPLAPRNAMVLGSWFLTREIELSCARACLLTLVTVDGKLTVQWTLPASKTDTRAEGVARTHGCSCSPGSISPACPAHAALDQLQFLQLAFPKRWKDGKPDSDLPLFPNAAGAVCTKEAMSATIGAAAARLGISAASPDGSERVSGHSLRVTGAQGLARLGVETWAIQLLGRWGSQAVHGYVREAALSRASTWAARAAAEQDLSSVVQDLSAGGKLNLKKKVAELVRAEVSGLLSPLTATTLLDEASRHQPPRPTMADAATDPQPVTRHVLNDTTGILHVLASEPTGALSGWSTVCGWRFASTSKARLCTDTLSVPHKRVCEKCLPELKAAKKAAFIAQATAQCGETTE